MYVDFNRKFDFSSSNYGSLIKVSLPGNYQIDLLTQVLKILCVPGVKFRCQKPYIPNLAEEITKSIGSFLF